MTFVKENQARPYRRSHFFINCSFQIRYMLYALTILLIVMGASVASVYYGVLGSMLRELSDEGVRNRLIMANRIYQYEKARQVESQAAQTPDSTLNFIRETSLLSQREREIFREILNHTHKRILFYFIPLLIFIGWGTIFLSHRIAGPLYRFDQCFRRLKGGDLTTRAHLRKHDEAVWLSESFNQMTEHLDGEVSALKRAAREITPELKNSDPSRTLLEKTLSGFQTSK